MHAIDQLTTDIIEEAHGKASLASDIRLFSSNCAQSHRSLIELDISFEWSVHKISLPIERNGR
jgi:hypothetical protein